MGRLERGFRVYKSVSPAYTETYWPPLELELWTPDGTEKYEQINREVNNIHFGTAAGVGYSAASYVVIRDPRLYHDDLKESNLFKIRCGDEYAWEGEIYAPGLSISVSDVSIPIDCVGHMNKLMATISTDAFGIEKGSAWITDHLIPHADLGLSVGYIDTNDYTFPAGLDAEEVYFIEVLDKINLANNYAIACWGNKFYYYPKSNAVDYYATVENGEVSITRSKENIENYLRVKWNDGAADHYFWWPDDGPDEESKELYGRRDGQLDIPGTSTEAQAETIAEVVLNEHKRMRPASDFKVSKVWDATTGIEINPALIKSHKVIHLENLYPAEQTIGDRQLINELSTFEITNTDYQIGDPLPLTISPGIIGLTAEMILARIEARSRV